jgi:protein TonB
MRPERIGLGVTLALHVCAAAALLGYEPARKALLAAAPIMVDMILPPEVEPLKPQPPTELPKPRPVAKTLERPIEPPLVAAPAEAPSPVAAPPPPPVQVVAPRQPEPVMVTQPIFNADYLDNPAPAYPGLSRRLREQGKVVLRVLVNPAGRTDEVQVRSSSGFARLDDAARDTVQRWKFVPAKRGAEPIAAWVLIPISFRLEG